MFLTSSLRFSFSFPSPHSIIPYSCIFLYPTLSFPSISPSFLFLSSFHSLLFTFFIFFFSSSLPFYFTVLSFMSPFFLLFPVPLSFLFFCSHFSFHSLLLSTFSFPYSSSLPFHFTLLSFMCPFLPSFPFLSFLFFLFLFPFSSRLYLFSFRFLLHYPFTLLPFPLSPFLLFFPFLFRPLVSAFLFFLLFSLRVTSFVSHFDILHFSFPPPLSSSILFSLLPSSSIFVSFPSFLPSII